MIFSGNSGYRLGKNIFKRQRSDIQNIQKLLKLNNKKTTQFKKWTKDLNRHLTTEDTQIANSRWEDAPQHRPPGKGKLKPQWEPPISPRSCRTHPWAWPGHRAPALAQVGAAGTLIRCQWEWKMGQSLLNVVWRLPTKLKTLVHEPQYCHSALWTQRGWKQVHTKNHSWLFTGAFFIIPQIWEQPRHCFLSEWLNELWCI